MLLRPDERSPPAQFATSLPASDCLRALKAAATPETVLGGLGAGEAILWRERGQTLELRPRRTPRHPREPGPIVVHTWFRVSGRTSPGETILEVSEHLGLQKGWWLVGALAGAFLALLATLSLMRWVACVALTLAAQGVVLVMGFLRSAGGDEADRAVMAAFLRRTVQAEAVVRPKAASRHDPRFY